MSKHFSPGLVAAAATAALLPGLGGSGPIFRPLAPAIIRARTNDAFATYDQATVDSTGAFLVNELERLDPMMHEPLASVTWQRDIDLREDVTRCFRLREHEEGGQLSFFDIGEQAPPVESDFKRRMVREAFTEHGWQRRVNDFAQAGATDEACLSFLMQEMPASQDKRYGDGWIRLTGGECPSITYLSDLTDKPRDRVHLAGKDLLKAFRGSFGIETTPKRAKRSA